MLLGFVGSIVSAILRSIPNYINRTRFAFWCMVPVTIALLFLLILLFISPNLKRKIAHIYENLFSAAIFLYAASMLFYYLPVIIMLATTLVNYGESAVSTIVLFRLIGYVLGIVCMLCAGLAIYKTLIKLYAGGCYFTAPLFVGDYSSQRLYLCIHCRGRKPRQFLYLCNYSIHYDSADYPLAEEPDNYGNISQQCRTAETESAKAQRTPVGEIFAGLADRFGFISVRFAALCRPRSSAFAAGKLYDCRRYGDDSYFGIGR